MSFRFSRRQWMKSIWPSGLGLLSGGSARAIHAKQDGTRYQTYWGDLHNHGAVGYARGSLRRSFEIARSHLDFFAFTPHAHWPDIGSYENHIENKWLDGFKVTARRWPEVREMAKEFDSVSKFVPILGYEWHSAALGDYHILFPTLEADLKLFDDLCEFQQFARKHGCIMVPHHPANRLGHRGANFAHHDPAVSPVVEIYSEWGNAEHDRAPFPYTRHTEGGRWTKNTVQRILAQGHRVGFVASTDDHLGYPGAYREGLAAIKATGLSRVAIFDALRNRRTYAVTGDRIGLDFTLNGHMMGSELPRVRHRRLEVSVTGWDEIDRVEVLKNNAVIHRDHPVDRSPSARSWDEPVLIRFEYGWGPWPALAMTRVCDWDIRIRIENGILQDVQTCFQSGPYEELRRDRLTHSGNTVRVESFTALREQFEDISTKGIVVKVRGTPETRITFSLEAPSRTSVTQTLLELADSGETLFTGPFPRESAMIHRLVFKDHYRTSFAITDTDGGSTLDWYYIRVVQSNGQMAWSSPIWVEAS